MRTAPSTLLLLLLLAVAASAQGFPPPPPGMPAAAPLPSPPGTPAPEADARACAPAGTASVAWAERTISVLLGSGEPVELRHSVIGGLPSTRIASLAADPEGGLLFVGTADRGLAAIRLDTGEPVPAYASLDEDLSGAVLSLAFSRDGKGGGTLVAGTGRMAHFVQINGGAPADLPVAVSADPRSSAVHAAAPAPWLPGGFLLGTAGGVFRASGDGALSPVEAEGLAERTRVRSARTLGEDLFLCTDFGLFSSRDGVTFDVVSKGENGLPSMTLDVARMQGGPLVLSTPKGLALSERADGAAPLPPAIAARLPDDLPVALAVARASRPPDAGPPGAGDAPALDGLWVGWKGSGLSLFGAAGFARLDVATRGISDDRVTAILPVGDAIYVATEGGLNRYRIVRPGARPAKKEEAGKGTVPLPPDDRLAAAIRKEFGVALDGPWSADSLRAIYRTLTVLPKEFRKWNTSMSRMGEAGSLGGLGTVGAPGWIRIYGAAFRDDPTGIRVIVHEMAHNFQGNAGVLAKWEREIKGPSCTRYGDTNRHEDMAESISYYYTKPALLKKRFPERYEFIRTNVMDGREFTGSDWK